jgi:hypothetical protein
MTSMEFALLWRAERDHLLSSFMDANSQSSAATVASGLGLSPDQARGVREVLELALTDTMYTLLLGLDGAASIGGRQESYRLFSEDGDQLSGAGTLEEAAWEVFHGGPGDA